MKKLLVVLISAVLCMTFAANALAAEGTASAPELEGHAFVSETELKYAECFHIYNYDGGYIVIDIPQSGTYLLVPEGEKAPKKTGMIVLQKPLDRIYLAATSAMALFNAVNSVDHIRLSGAQASGWYVEAAVEALNSGAMIYAGKYSEPDYEILISEDCNLAIESTMIYHTPKVKEMIEDLDIPVLVDRSSYESHPLGKTEWVKVYAAITDKVEEGEVFFNEQAKVIEDIKDLENTEKTVAFFYVNTDGSIVIRNPKDYIPNMIELGGGRYAFRDLETTETAASFSITMEDFYTVAHSADYIIYNGSINAPIESIDELIGKDALFAEFKAVQDGNVWSVGKDFYQSTDIQGQLIRDVSQMVTGNTDKPMIFLTKVD